jgi:hypothetical protein
MTSVATGSSPLRRVLLLDASASGAMGLIFLLAASPLERLLGLPASLLRGVGLVLVPFAAFLVWLAPRASALRVVVRSVVGANVFWVAASVLLLVTGWVDPTPVGTAFVIVQAVAVLGIAYLEGRAGVGRHESPGPLESSRSAV